MGELEDIWRKRENIDQTKLRFRKEKRSWRWEDSFIT